MAGVSFCLSLENQSLLNNFNFKHAVLQQFPNLSLHNRFYTFLLVKEKIVLEKNKI